MTIRFKFRFKKDIMTKQILIFLCISALSLQSKSQKLPCSNPEFRQFDFWIGKWDVYGKNGKKAGDSKITLILDSCVILEEWTSSTAQNNLLYKGKSFNSYNAGTKQWQQTWVDNTGNTTEFLRGEASNGKIVYYADKVNENAGKTFMRRLTFTKNSDSNVRQLGERSDDQGVTWTIEYDLEYKKISH
jgi:hypothetical protein